MKLSTLYIYRIIISVCIALCVNIAVGADKIPFTVVIDAGHGGKDVGAVDNGVKEKDINLGVALQLEKLIKKDLKDVKVVMTRDNDTFLTLQQRADKANQAKGNLFISIHTNSVDASNKNRRTVAGSSVYVLGLHKDDNNMRVAMRENSVIELEKNFEQKYSGFDPSKDESYIIFEMAQKKNLSKSIKFANDAQKQLIKVAGRADRGVHQAGFWVLWATSMPAVLVEVDFICNPNSAKYIASTEGQTKLAQALFNAVKNYSVSYRKSMTGSGGKKTRVSVEDNSDSNAAEASVATLVNVEKENRDDTPPVVSYRPRGEGKYAEARRRRRSDSAKAISDNRNVETASIPLHNPDERLAKTETTGAVDFDSDADDSDRQSKITSKKLKKDNQKGIKATKVTKKGSDRKGRSVARERSKMITVYKIQILASHDQLQQNNPRFCGLFPISCFKDKNFFKYTYGESENKKEIETLLKEVRKKIPDAFIVEIFKSAN